MPTFLEAILADPAAFLSCNAANMTGNVQLAPGESGTFKARRQPTFKVRYRTGSKFLGMGNAKATGDAWELRAHKPGDGTSSEEQLFEAIWSGYGGGLATHCTLGTGGGPDLMLTPRVDGCTLTFGPAAGGGVRFGHYNLKDGAATLAGPQMAAAATNNYEGVVPAVFSKEFYYSKAKRETSPALGRRTFVNAVGVRKNGLWRFYVQYLESKGDGFQIRGVDELQAGAQYIAAAHG